MRTHDTFMTLEEEQETILAAPIQAIEDWKKKNKVRQQNKEIALRWKRVEKEDNPMAEYNNPGGW